ncbi:hypothetical protein GALMADRAFT_209906 [Galerina marginata CBS 339.88]|uniref:Uncharacterized protein n=1 Tax=Galerina marginata (strain CBS 339.88) TaxID=685588 RepID=A0A067TCI6_GALM3|nr:hypothetical protein GALMADRAFT_209906 [Galerina marginata CBS 339.88]
MGKNLMSRSRSFYLRKSNSKYANITFLHVLVRDSPPKSPSSFGLFNSNQPAVRLAPGLAKPEPWQRLWLVGSRYPVNHEANLRRIEQERASFKLPLARHFGGLINAYVLLQDGFTRPSEVHGLEILLTQDCRLTNSAGYLSGVDIRDYMEKCDSNFLEQKKTKFRMQTEVFDNGALQVKVQDHSPDTSILCVFRIILATGGCSSPFIPESLSVCANLASEGRRMAITYEKTDAFIAGPSYFLRKTSNLVSVFCNDGFEMNHDLLPTARRFLHTTTFGRAISYSRFLESHCRISIQISDEGIVRPNNYHSLANSDAIEGIAPARMVLFSNDGLSILLSHGRSFRTKSSWTQIFTPEVTDDVGMSRRLAQLTSSAQESSGFLELPEFTSPFNLNLFGIAQRLYANEVATIWIDWYFHRDEMHLPAFHRRSSSAG